MNSILRATFAAVVALAASLGDGTASGEDKPGMTSVEYAPVRPDGADGIASIRFSSDATARLSFRTGAPVDVTWSTYSQGDAAGEGGALLRLRSAKNEVWWFGASEMGLLRMPHREKAGFARTGARGQPLPEMFLGGSRAKVADILESRRPNETIFVLSADSLDWLPSDGRGVACTYKRTPGDGMEFAMPDGTKRMLVPSEDGVSEGPGKPVYVSFLEAGTRTDCMSNLQQLAQIFLMRSMENRGKAMRYSGAGWFLDLLRSGDITAKNASVLFCPADPQAVAPETKAQRAAWVKAADPDAPGNDACSYATRDFAKFPLKLESPDKQAVMCCRCGRDGKTPHHRGGNVIAFDAGDVRFMTKSDLGLGPDDPIVVGAESKSPILKVMVFLPAKK